MEIDLSLDNDLLKIELSNEAELKGITLEKHISDILEESVKNQNDN